MQNDTTESITKFLDNSEISTLKKINLILKVLESKKEDLIGVIKENHITKLLDDQNAFLYGCKVVLLATVLKSEKPELITANHVGGSESFIWDKIQCY